MPIAVKNRAPAPIQVSAEQLLREARDRQVDVEMPKARRQITDAEELKEYRMSKRKESLESGQAAQAPTGLPVRKTKCSFSINSTEQGDQHPLEDELADPQAHLLQA